MLRSFKRFFRSRFQWNGSQVFVRFYESEGVAIYSFAVNVFEGIFVRFWFLDSQSILYHDTSQCIPSFQARRNSLLAPNIADLFCRWRSGGLNIKTRNLKFNAILFYVVSFLGCSWFIFDLFLIDKSDQFIFDHIFQSCCPKAPN